jgi:hypothetical protein
MWREFSDTRWAASAGHLFDRQVISSEVWTWLHSPAFRATPLDMKAEADLHFLQGVNQLVGHGWPYSPEEAGEPGWRMYAAAALNTHNPWSFAMPDLAGYLQRVSFALREGKPANDVAVLLPNDDAWATFRASSKQARSMTSSAGFDESGLNVSIDESMPKLLGHEVLGNILDAGFNVDFVDADAIEKVGIPYPVLVLPGIDRIPPQTYRKIEDYARRGGIVIATRRLPGTLPGMPQSRTESASISVISKRLFQGEHPLAHYVADERDVGKTVTTYLKPDVTFFGNAGALGFIHRKFTGGDLYFIANTTNATQHAAATFRQRGKYVEDWNAFTGDIGPTKESSGIDLNLEPYESRLVFIMDLPSGNSTAQPVDTSSPARQSPAVDLSRDWDVTFAGLARSVHMPTLRSWEADESTKFYSGIATYERDVTLGAADLRPGISVVLDFGAGAAVPLPDPLPAQNMRAYFEGPVREAAEVYVNGSRAGVVWHPPYSLPVTQWLKPGSNKLRVIVGNTAINALSGRALPDYRLLDDRFGVRFVPQGMENLHPLESGILGHPHLVFRHTAAGESVVSQP